MHESDPPTPTDDAGAAGDELVTDTELDAIAADLDTVEAAMTALDADDFDRAEALAASLETIESDTTESGEPIETTAAAEPAPDLVED